MVPTHGSGTVPGHLPQTVRPTQARTHTVIGKGGDDPRLEDDASAQIFTTYTCLVIRAYANKVPQELAYDVFDTFPYPIQMFLVISPDS